MNMKENTIGFVVPTENTIVGPGAILCERSINFSITDWNGEKVFIFLTVDGAKDLSEVLMDCVSHMEE